MRIEIPIFRQIQRDATLPLRAFQVWCASIDFLDLVEWRELKSLSIEKALEVDPSTVSRGLSTLVERGYLRRKATTSGISLFRVPLSRATDDTSEVVDASELVEREPSRVSRTRGARVHSRGVV